MFEFVCIDHVQLAMPKGGEDRARAFFVGVLGFAEIPKPAKLAARGGCWFEAGGVQIHLGWEEEFRPAKKAHPAFRVRGYDACCVRLLDAGHKPVPNDEIADVRRAHVDDPFGNRLEIIEDKATSPAV